MQNAQTKRNYTEKSRADGRAKVDTRTRKLEILRAMQIYGAPMSCRDVADELYCMGVLDHPHRQDVAPRITEMRLAGWIEAVGREKDTVSGVSVTVYEMTSLGAMINSHNPVRVDRAGHILLRG